MSIYAWRPVVMVEGSHSHIELCGERFFDDRKNKILFTWQKDGSIIFGDWWVMYDYPAASKNERTISIIDMVKWLHENNLEV